MGPDRLSDYDFFLPEDRIAQTPLADRAASRMLHVARESGVVTHRVFRDFPDLLQAGDLLILNNTRVTATRLFGKKANSGGEVELLLMGNGPAPGTFRAMVRPAKRLKVGAEIALPDGYCARVIDELADGHRMLEFAPLEGLPEWLQTHGQVPLPPYIHTKLQEAERYQTVYSAVGGSAAAPTAGLHFTPQILTQIEERGVGIAFVTLNVGLDTFRPISSENLDEHPMHGEWCEVPEATAQAVAHCQGRVIAVGTTSCRTLESASLGPRVLQTTPQETKLFIRPGYVYKTVDGLLTNFHMPRTTMLLMLAALVGREPLLEAYASAIAEQYRFLSFGDSMLIL